VRRGRRGAPSCCSGSRVPGKTEVFLGAAKRGAGSAGSRCWCWCPRSASRLSSWAGSGRGSAPDVAVLHSGLTGAERLAAVAADPRGRGERGVGARSRVVRAVRGPGLIVVDEEHDDSYKQDEGVPYTRAIWRCARQTRGLPGGARLRDPSLESWQNAEAGRYGLLELPRRATSRPVPVVELVDMTQPRAAGGAKRRCSRPRWCTRCGTRSGRGGQAIVLYNRRGYATMVQCTNCGGTYECPNCGVSMTLHKTDLEDACHYCGLTLPYAGRLPGLPRSPARGGRQGHRARRGELAGAVPRGPTREDGRRHHGGRAARHRRDPRRLPRGAHPPARRHADRRQGARLPGRPHRGRGERRPRVPDAGLPERGADGGAARAGRGPGGPRRRARARVLVQTWKPDHYVLQHLGRRAGIAGVGAGRAALHGPGAARDAPLSATATTRAA
jgi:hypothetical protein